LPPARYSKRLLQAFSASLNVLKGDPVTRTARAPRRQKAGSLSMEARAGGALIADHERKAVVAGGSPMYRSNRLSITSRGLETNALNIERKLNKSTSLGFYSRS